MKWTSQLIAVRIAILFIVLIVVISGLSVYWTSYSVVPSLEDTVTLNGLKGEVTVAWDTHQVPRIKANHEPDLFLAMGFLHARDRLWQMTRKQYKLEGLHSREIAESMVDIDRFFLTMSFGAIAKEVYRQLPQPEKVLLDAYAKGVNAFIDKHHRHLPPEFALGDVQPIAWEPWHSIGVLILWSWDQQQAFWAKPAMANLHYIEDGTAIRALTGMDNARELLWGSGQPSMEENAYISLLDDFYRFSETAAPPRSGLTGTGAAFARTGANPFGLLTYTRESLLTLPDPGYEMALQKQDNWYYGVTIPGLPVFTGGQNEHLAWKILPLISDNGFFFTGELFRDPPPRPVDWENDPDIESRLNPNLSLDRHILPLRNGGELLVVTKKAGHRPVVAVSEEYNRYLAFEWVGPAAADDIAALFSIRNANGPEQLQRAAESLAIPPVQILYVTAGGQTGRITGGKLNRDTQPFRIRETGERDTPVATIDASVIVPHQHNATGNPVTFIEQPVPAHANAGEKCLFAPPWNRSERLLQLLEQTPEDRLVSDIIGQWSNDTYSSYAAELTPIIVSALEVSATENGTDPVLELVIPYLRNWNYRFDPNETAATLFQQFQKTAARNLYRPWLEDRDIQMLFKTPNILYSAVTELLLHPERWPETHPYTHREWITVSMKETLGFLESNYGNEPYDWQWNRVVDGSFQPVLFEETRMNSRPARLAERNLFQPEGMTVSGSPHSIKAMYPQHNRDAISKAAGVTMKGIMMVRPEHRYYSVLSTGQSGNLFSGHFIDQFTLWNQGMMKQPVLLPPDQTHDIKNIQRFIP
ncbi:MAG: hypothetical protein EA363_06050 [Balneolaceae bacterium]|nr:MAG: hypothetical protein EA363_06050 [Balneolaceae bacterium]